MAGTRESRAARVSLPLVAVTALAAALFGWSLLFQDRSGWTTVFVVLGSTALGWLVAVLLVWSSPGRDELEVPAREPVPRPAHERPLGPAQEQQRALENRRAEAGPDGAAPRTAQLVLPIERPVSTPPAAQWWNREASPPPASAARAAEPARPAPRDLAALRDDARVVQCPNCGAFRVDVRHTDTGYLMRCRVDRHEWSWTPGTAWPVTVVASRRRTP
ncbi:hypothetical protein I6A60_34140 [Frankia sp. AgB1.9]|uniref:hypothetical protein n=1 Tax=unclassified Frankia TaxID=2632575 RepID=UPI0019329796|nr:MULTISPECIES: hypothetical protein [unclassified Frankia]MBL7488146.1 hypothetical protein [Frankia sp. AgW1.1]MBL7552858.1 hypothetical protein [Frankia sp. AgB1.9]MBL7620149.1 hypothetical protein [Frankia sp. AgB1.8]